MPIPIHKFLVIFLPVLGAIPGVLLGFYLVHGFPPEGELGWQACAASGGLGVLGFLIPTFLMRMIPARCSRCGWKAYLQTDSTFLKGQLAQYVYRCRSCRYEEGADFSRR